MYDKSTERKLKGVPRATVQQQCRHQDYLHYLSSDGRQTVNFHRIVTMMDQQIFTVYQTKKALSSFDSKRRLIENNETRAHGHYAFRKDSIDTDEEMI